MDLLICFRFDSPLKVQSSGPLTRYQLQRVTYQEPSRRTRVTPLTCKSPRWDPDNLVDPQIGRHKIVQKIPNSLRRHPGTTY